MKTKGILLVSAALLVVYWVYIQNAADKDQAPKVWGLIKPHRQA